MPRRPGWPWKQRSSCPCLPKLGLKALTTTPTLEIMFHGLSQYWTPVVVVPVSRLCLYASVLSRWPPFSFVFHAVLLRLECFVVFLKKMTRACTCATAYLLRSNSLHEVVFFYQVGPGDWTQSSALILRLGSRHPYPALPSHWPLEYVLTFFIKFFPAVLQIKSLKTPYSGSFPWTVGPRSLFLFQCFASIL